MKCVGNLYEIDPSCLTWLRSRFALNFVWGGPKAEKSRGLFFSEKKTPPGSKISDLDGSVSLKAQERFKAASRWWRRPLWFEEPKLWHQNLPYLKPCCPRWTVNVVKMLPITKMCVVFCHDKMAGHVSSMGQLGG